MKSIRLIPALASFALLLAAGQAWAGSAHVEWLNGNLRGGPPGETVLEAGTITGFGEDVTTSTGAAVQSSQAPAFVAGEGWARVTARNAAEIVTPIGTASTTNGWLIPQGQTRLIPVAAGARLSILEDPVAAAAASVSCSACATASGQTTANSSLSTIATNTGADQAIAGSDASKAGAVQGITGGKPVNVQPDNVIDGVVISGSAAAAGDLTNTPVSTIGYSVVDVDVITLTATSVTPSASIDGGTTYETVTCVDMNSVNAGSTSSLTNTHRIYECPAGTNFKLTQVGAGSSAVKIALKRAGTGHVSAISVSPSMFANGSGGTLTGLPIVVTDGTNNRMPKTDTGGNLFARILAGSTGSQVTDPTVDTNQAAASGLVGSALLVACNDTSPAAITEDRFGVLRLGCGDHSLFVGGRYNATPPTVSDTTTAGFQLGNHGQLMAGLMGTTGADAVTAGPILIYDVTGTARLIGNAPYGYNGTTEDRLRTMQGAAGDGVGVAAEGNYLQKAATYSVGGNVSLAQPATDACVLTGSGTKTVAITKIRVSGVQTTGGNYTVQITKHSAADSGGTGTTVTPVPHLSTNAASTATFTKYTVNPTVNGLVGSVRSDTVWIPSVTTAGVNGIEYNFAANGQPIILSGTAQEAAVNMASNSLAGGSLFCTFEYYEY